MNKIAVLGAGMVGSAIARDLATRFEVTSFDMDDQALKSLAGVVAVRKSDLSDTDSYEELLKEFDAVVCAVPGFMGYKSLEAVIRCGKNVVDISFFPENALDLKNLALEHGVTAIVDCGVAPGMDNIILGHHDSEMEVEFFECLVGGLPLHPKEPFNYKAPFSPIDVIEEYTRPARYVENGKIITKNAMSDQEPVDFDKVGTLEAFNTDGLRSLLFTMNHIPNMKEKTLRYPGHIDLIKQLRGAGFFNAEPIKVKDQSMIPLEFTSAMLISEWKLAPEEPEFTVMRVTVKGKKSNVPDAGTAHTDTSAAHTGASTAHTDVSAARTDASAARTDASAARTDGSGTPKTVIYELYDEYDATTKTSSMARTTGYTCTAVVNLLADGLFNKKGLFPPELVGREPGCLDYILRYLRQRGVIYKVTEN